VFQYKDADGGRFDGEISHEGRSIPVIVKSSVNYTGLFRLTREIKARSGQHILLVTKVVRSSVDPDEWAAGGQFDEGSSFPVEFDRHVLL
jgi:hypothetical protein